MKNLFYIILIFLVSCGMNKVVFQDDVYDNTITLNKSTKSYDLYEDEYYMSNRAIIYNPYFYHRSRYGFCIVNSSFYDSYFVYKPYNYYPYWTNRGWNSVNYNYSYWYPNYNYSYIWKGNSLTYKQSSQIYINSPRRYITSSYRGNTNTVGTTNPTYTRSSYNKSKDDTDNKVDSYRRNNNINNNRTNVRNYSTSSPVRVTTPSYRSVSPTRRP